MADWQQVEGSSNVQAIAYNEGAREVSVKFHNGNAIYTYEDVSPEQWEELLKSQSKGRYVQIELRRAHKSRMEKPPDPKPSNN